MNKTKFILEKYIKVFNDTEKKNLSESQNYIIEFNSNKVLPSLKDAWLSGFIDTESCFDLEEGEILIFSLVQYNELDLFNHIANLFLINQFFYKNKVFNDKIYNRIYFTKKESIIKLMLYLDEYPLYSNKNISLVRYRKILLRKLDDVDRSNKPRALSRFKRLKSLLNILNKYIYIS